MYEDGDEVGSCSFYRATSDNDPHLSPLDRKEVSVERPAQRSRPVLPRCSPSDGVLLTEIMMQLVLLTSYKRRERTIQEANDGRR